MKTVKVFLASSEELKDDRVHFGDLIRQLNDIFGKRGIEIKLLKWEDFNAAYTGMRKQDEYNLEIDGSDIFIALFHRKAGKFTLEEVGCAIKHFKEEHLPNIYIYMKDLKEGEVESLELKQFKDDLLNRLGHYSCTYNSSDAMKLNFLLQFEAYENFSSDNDCIKIGSQGISIDGKKIVNLNNVSFASMNNEYNRLKEELAKADKEMNELRIKFTNDPTDSELLGELVSKSAERNKINEEFEKYQQYLYNTALKFTKLSGNVYSERIEKARALFEKGKVADADQILNEEDMKKETASEIEQFDIYREHLESIIEEYLLKTETSMSNDKLSIKDRFNQACRAYDEAIKIAKKIDYDKFKISEILFKYACLYKCMGQYSKAIPKFKELLDITNNIEYKKNDKCLCLEAEALLYLGNIYSSICQEDEAETKIKEALHLYVLLSKQCPDNYLSKVEGCYNDLGIIYQRKHNYKESKSAYIESWNIIN